MERLGTSLIVLLLFTALSIEPAFGQTWREEADARIDEHRKADLSVVVQDHTGAPLEGAQVNARMTRHAFHFGTAVNSRFLREGAAVDFRNGSLPLGAQPTGLRFQVDLPPGAEVTAAYVQFTSASDDQTESTELEIRAQDSSDAPDFRYVDISSRSTTSVTVAWSVPEWSDEDDAGEAQRTPDLAELLQSVLDGPAWASGNHVALIITGSGERSVHSAREAMEQGTDVAPVLIVEANGETFEVPIVQLPDNAFELASAEDASRYREALLRLFNYATLENAMKWHWWERDRQLAIDGVEWLEEHGFTIRGHHLVYADPPSRIHANSDDLEYVRSQWEEHIVDITSVFAGRLDAWDALNEVLNLPFLPDALGVDDYAHWTQVAHATDPDALLFINEYSVVEGGVVYEEYIELTQELLDAGAEIHGIGLQGHFWWEPVSPETLWERLEAVAALGLPMDVTEFDMNIDWSPQQQAEQLEHFLVTFFSHPQARVFQMWEFWDENHWRDNSPLYDVDWNVKPSGEVWYDLVHNQWWTNENLQSDASGMAEVRGFLGDYVVEVEYEGETYAVSHTLEAGGSEVLVQMPAVSAEDGPDGMLDLLTVHGSYPNPVSQEASITFDLGEDAEVELMVYDLLGRQVMAVEAHRLTRGTSRELRVDVSDLSSGVYAFRIQATGATGTVSQNGRITVVR